MTFLSSLSNFSIASRYIVLFPVAILFTLFGCSEKHSKEDITPSYFHTANLLTINPVASYGVSSNYIGKIIAKHHSKLSFEYSGKVNFVAVDSGDFIKKGQLLAQQDTELFTIKSTELQAQVKQTTARMKLNLANLKRIHTLKKDGYSSAQRLDELSAEKQVLEAKKQGLEAAIQTINYQIKKAKLLAPYNAIIGDRMVSAGEVITAGSPVFRLIEQNHNEIKVGIPSKLATTLTLDQVFKVKIGEHQANAKLISIGKQIDQSNRTVLLRLSLLNSVESFNGQLVRVAINRTIVKDGFWLPLTAITDGVRGQWNVYLALKSDQRYIIQPATINVLHATKDAVYVSGLPLQKNLIVSEGLHRFAPGQVVKRPSDLANTGDKL